MFNDIQIYVITLLNKLEYIKIDNYKSLSTITNKIILVNGVILNKKQCDKYYFLCKEFNRYFSST